jgi:hypothetical protein
MVNKKLNEKINKLIKNCTNFPNTRCDCKENQCKMRDIYNRDSKKKPRRAGRKSERA